MAVPQIPRKWTCFINNATIGEMRGQAYNMLRDLASVFFDCKRGCLYLAPSFFLRRARVIYLVGVERLAVMYCSLK